ncbi:hypothetical protein BC828DRAFT_250006 [Blastocladiella britannica]|nr:hypothetical protein BC828DRAFT_250006 [Blastocladiella britannica]
MWSLIRIPIQTFSFNQGSVPIYKTIASVSIRWRGGLTGADVFGIRPCRPSGLAAGAAQPSRSVQLLPDIASAGDLSGHRLLVLTRGRQYRAPIDPIQGGSGVANVLSVAGRDRDHDLEHVEALPRVQVVGPTPGTRASSGGSRIVRAQCVHLRGVHWRRDLGRRPDIHQSAVYGLERVRRAYQCYRLGLVSRVLAHVLGAKC